MNRLLSLYNSFGRWGNIILLGLLILFGIVNRVYTTVSYGFTDYIIEILVIVLALIIIYKIFKKNIFEINSQNIFKALLILGIVLRIILGVHDLLDRPVQDSDYLKHEKLGARIAFEGRFYDFTGVELRNFRQPGLPVLFALALWIYNNPIVYGLVMTIFSFGVMLAGFFLFRNLNNIAAIISFAYLAISPNMLFMASNSNTQLSFFFFVILLFIALKKYSGKIYQLLIIGAILAAEMYIRFNFFMIFILIPFIIAKHREQNLAFALRKLSFIYLSFIILYSPWVYRNYQIYGTIRLMPTTGLGLYSSNVSYDYKKLGGYNGVPDSLLKKYSNLSEIEFDNAFKKEAIDFVESHPEIYIKGLPFRIIKYSDRQDWTINYFWAAMKFPNSELLRSVFQTIENFFFWIILFFPFIFLIRRKNFPPISVYILWAYLSYSMFLIPFSETRSRYNFPYILFPIFAVALIDKKNYNSLNN